MKSWSRTYATYSFQMWCVSAHDCVLRGIGNIIIRMTHLYVCANSTLNFFIYYVNGKVSMGGKGVIHK